MTRLLALLLVLWVATYSRSAVIDATDPSYDAVSNAVRVASAGDIVLVPPGTATWTRGLILSNNIVLRSTFGPTLTIITNEVPKTSPQVPMIRTVSTSTNGIMRISGFTIKGGIISTQETTDGIIRLTGVCKSNIIDGNVFNLLWGVGIDTGDFTLGVIANNDFMVQGYHPVTVNHNEWQPYNGATNDAGTPYIQGNGSWADDSYWGTDRFMFIEGNRMHNNKPDEVAIDQFQGARAVVRYNISTNCSIGNHGTEGQGRSAKQTEVYMNDWRQVGVSSSAPQIRGGSWLIWSNQFNGFANGHQLLVYRQFTSKANWNWANGTNVYDLNDPDPVNGWWARGQHTGPNDASTLTDSTAAWTTGQWIGTNHGFQLRNMTKYVGEPVADTPNSFVIGNTGTTISYSTLDDPNLRFDTGDFYEVWKLVQAIDQPGTGKDDGRMNGLPATPAHWPTNATEICYAWANTTTFGGPVLRSPVPNITEGRHFTNGVAKAGYTPYLYPHPLSEATVFNILAVNPPAPTVAPGGTVDFDAVAGSGDYFYRITTNNSGASINSSTGLYTAGPTSSVVDTIQVVDLYWGNTVETTATISGTPVIVTGSLRLTRRITP